MRNYNKHFIISLGLLIWNCSVWAQDPLVFMELNTTETTTKNYLARDYVKLKPGFSFSSNSNKTFNAKVDPRLLFPPTSNTYIDANGDITNDPTVGYIVGAIPGQFAVSPSGGATYSIPIEVPAGINGMQPNISLVYNSQGGNGIAGWGWNISGMSAITRTQKSKYFDDFISPITWDDTCALSLDGQRLIKVESWPDAAGADSIEYRTENESYSRIVACSMQTWGPEYFKVYTKSGMKMIYGNPQSLASYSPVYDNAATDGLTGENYERSSWNLVEIIDNNANYIQFEYLTSLNSKVGNVIRNINYGSNKAKIGTALALTFNYESRTDKLQGWIAGKEYLTELRLKSIQTTVGSVEQRLYTLNYETGRRPTSVELKHNGTAVLSPLTFVYGTTNTTETDEDISFITKDTNNADKTKLGLTAIDFNGDGIAEIGDVFESTDASFPGYVSCNFGVHYKKDDWENTTYFPLSANFSDIQKGFKSNFGDFNANGTIESVFAYKNAADNLHISIRDRGNNNASLFNGNIGTATNAPFIAVGNFYGTPCSSAIIIFNDPVTQSNGTFNYKYKILRGNLNGSISHLGQNPEYYLNLSSKIKTIDITNIRANNLYDDIWVNLENGTNLLIENNFSSNQVFSGGTTIQTLLPFNIESSELYRFVDLNQDGLTDIVYRDNVNNLWIAYNKGNLNFSINYLSLQCSKDTNDEDKIEFTDYNNDGFVDIIIGNEKTNSGVFSTTFWSFYLNNGSGGFVIDILKTKSSPERSAYSCFADVYGDGRVYWVHSPTSGEVVITDFGYGINNNQLTEVFDPLQGTQTIEYKTLADCNEVDIPLDLSGDINETLSYYLGLGFQPFKTSALSLVSKYTGGLTKQSYHYGTALSNWNVRGFVGFRFTAIDDETSEVSIFNMSKPICDNTSYQGPYLLLPRVARTSSLLKSTDNLINEQTYTYSITKNANNKKFITKLDNQKEFDSLKGVGILSTFTYDDFGNLLNLEKDYQQSYGDLTEVHEYEYEKRGAWCKNKVKSETTTLDCEVQTIVDDDIQSTIIREKTFTYDDFGNLETETVDPSDANSVTTVYSDFNDFGQAETVSVSANGNTRTSSVTYTPSGRFILSKTNVLDETTTYSWDEEKGRLDSETNPFIGTKSYTYNAVNQLVSTTAEDGTKAISLLQWANPGNDMGAKYYKYTQASGSAAQYVWYNDKGQVIQEDSYGLDNKKISVSTEYNDREMLYRKSEPYFVADASSKKWAVTNTYDDFGRISSSTNLDDKTTSYDYNNDTNPKTTTINSPEGTTVIAEDGYGNKLFSTVNGKTVFFANDAAGRPLYSIPESNDYDYEIGAPIKMEYDLQGNRTKITDPDAGVIETTYNGFGELIDEKQKVHNATNFVVTTNTYDDENGRLLNIDRNGEVTTYTYDPVQKGRVNSIEIVGKNKQTFTYDAYNRITNVKEEIGDKAFNTSKTYNANGRVSKEIHPSGYYTVNHYDPNGYITQITDKSANSIWKAVSENARGQITEAMKGTKSIMYDYQPNGLPYTMSADTIVDMEYVFNDEYNLLSREDKTTSQKEVMGYDTQNRLTTWTTTRDAVTYPAKTITFDDATDEKGNILQKSDLNNYVMAYGEGNNKPHALTSIASVPSIFPQPTTTYPLADLNVTYTDFKKIKKLSAMGKTYEITYGVDDQRRKSVYKENGVTKLTRYYLGNYEEEIDDLGNIKQIHYLSGAILIRVNNVETLYYSYADYQGSLIALTDKDGTVVEKYAYDPWGARRNPTNWNETDSRTSWIVNRGYTGHEHIDKFNIINMNGRVYDPLTAQFLSPDPYVQAPGNWLNYNRYSYCFGNPFKYTDPSGEFIFTALLAPTGLAPLGVILDGACWGGAINAVKQGIGIAIGKQDKFNFAELKGAAIGGAVFAGMGLISPAFTVTSTSFMKNLPTYLAKAGYASLAGGVSTGASMLATDIYDNGKVDILGKNYIKAMIGAGLVSGGLSFGSSLYDYSSWDKYTISEKLNIVKNKYGNNIVLDTSLDSRSSLTYGEYTGGDANVRLSSHAFKTKAMAFSTAKHELKHLSTFNKIGTGEITLSTQVGLSNKQVYTNYTEARSHLLEMKFHMNSTRYYVNRLYNLYGKYGYSNLSPVINPVMFINSIY